MREEYIEGRFREGVKRRGGIAIKLQPTIAGLPDRMVLLPGGRIRFVELKRPDGTVSAIQKVMHSKLHGLGFPVSVLWSIEDVNRWVSEL